MGQVTVTVTNLFINLSMNILLVMCSLGCNVLMRSDDVGNEGKVEGLVSPILDWKYLDTPAWENFTAKQNG